MHILAVHPDVHGLPDQYLDPLVKQRMSPWIAHFDVVVARTQREFLHIVSGADVAAVDVNRVVLCFSINLYLAGGGTNNIGGSLIVPPAWTVKHAIAPIRVGADNDYPLS